MNHYYFNEIEVSHEFLQYADLEDPLSYIRRELMGKLLFEVPIEILEKPHYIKFQCIDTRSIPNDWGWLDLNDRFSQSVFMRLKNKAVNKYRYSLYLL